MALLLIPLLAISGFVIDVGFAYFTQRSLQTQADAAALAGAQKLPDPSLSWRRPSSTGAARQRRTTRAVSET